MEITKSKKIIIAIVAIICVVAGGFALFNKPEQAEAGWWDDTWLYRKSVAVTNNTSAESNVYIAVTITNTNTLITNGKMQADCGDLRWTDYNGNVLPYYIGSECNQASSVVHIQLESFPAGAQTIYYYYGNPSATDGFEASDFATVASSYTPGTIGDEEKGPGPAAYWNFDEGYGDTTYDSSDNANNGTRGGGTAIYKPTWQTEDMCVSGKCLHFDGTDDYVDLSSSISNFSSLSVGTIEAWFKTSASSPTLSTIISVSDSGDPGSEFVIRIPEGDTNDLRIVARENGVMLIDASVDDLYNDGNWHHVIYSVNASGNTIYVDGVAVPVTYSTGNSSSHIFFSDVNDLDFMAIGVNKNNGGLQWFYDGAIDSVRIYPYARTAAQIRKDYNAGLAGLGGGTEGLGAALGHGGSQKWMTDGLVGYWNMDEGSGTTAYDASDNSNDGTLTNGPKWTEGKEGGGLQFDGSNYLTSGNVLDFERDQSFTLSTWIKRDSLIADRYVILGKRLSSGTYRGYYLSIESDHTLHFMLTSNATGNSVGVRSTLEIDDTSWYHIILTYNGSSEASGCKLYINGNMDTNITYDTLTDTTITTADFNIAARNNGVDIFSGIIDEVRIYNRALSPKEVRDLYNFAPGPVMHLKMDENTGTGSNAVKDTSCNENHGTMEATMTESDWVPGKYGSALQFDGTDDYVSVSDFAY